MVAVGLISYSMYLLHWPLIVLHGAYTFRDVTSVDKSVLLLATAAGAALMYRLVERPFRRGAVGCDLAAGRLGLAHSHRATGALK